MTAAASARTSARATAKPPAADGNITIAPAAGLLPGPMTITPVYCGKLSAGQRKRFGTTAAGGLIYRYANHSGTVTGAAKLFVGFTDGAAVAGENYAGQAPEIGSGQSAEGEVDALSISGRDLKFNGCRVESYALVTNFELDPVSYAG